MKQLVLIMCLFYSGLSSAQVDSHYWTHQFGAKGLLLNGAVISTANDETSIYYNPGAIAMDEDIGLAFSFLTPTYSRLKTNNFLGNNTNIIDGSLGFSPGFLAARFAPFNSKKVVIGVSSFTRYNSDIGFKDRVVDEIRGISKALFRGDLNFRRKISEDWFGLSLGIRLSDSFGIGISQFSMWHDQNLDIEFKKEILNFNSPEDIILSWRSAINYSVDLYGGWLTKVGFSFDKEDYAIGLTFTSPVYGISRRSANYTIDDQRINNIESTNSVVSNRDDIEVLEYRTPLSVGLGFDFKVNKYRLYFSTEYFTAIEKYTVFEESDDPFDGLGGGDTALLDFGLETSNQAVLNVALGFEYDKNEKVTYLGGFRTDFNESNSLKLNGEAEYLGVTPNVFHLSGGGMFKIGKNTFSFGVDLGYGQRSGGRQLVDLSDIDDKNIFTFSGNENVSSNFGSVMLFITYDFIFDRIVD